MPGTIETTVVPLDVWEFGSEGSEATLVRLPHDAMIAEPRTADAAGGAEIGYFPGGRYVYRTTWTAPTASAFTHVALRFEGVQGEATVAVNGEYVGEIRSGYTEFEFSIEGLVRWGEDNRIEVDVDNSAQPAGRWYPGSGLYRPVHLVLRPATHIASDGLRLATRSLDRSIAVIDVTISTSGPRKRGLSRVARLLDADGVVVASARSSESTNVATLTVPDPRPWSAEHPYLYVLDAALEIDGVVVDRRREKVGLRTVAVDARSGLQINGVTTLLRGACIHHDNGVLGAAAHRAAEFRRIRLLKSAGFNAIRSAHHPMGRHLLDACDELGMYVLDELADYWFVSKTAHDFAGRFRETWRDDVDRLVEKNRNRASVIMYASGNEIPETARPDGVALSREITEYFHRQDPTRPVTVAINLFLNTLVSLDKSPYREAAEGEEQAALAGSTEANVMINQIGRMMDLVSRLPRADRASKDAFATVDVAGYNYGLGRYRHDTRAYPDRVILGSETLPGDVARAWALVQKYPAVIGDFVWAGWEYLGEAGVSVWVPGKRAGLSKPYPYVISGPGMFDLIGDPDITLRLAQAAWGTLTAPAIGVRPVDLSGVPMVRSAWRKTDAVESWSWRGCDGRNTDIEVYSADDEVELRLNGRRIGRRRTGSRRGFFARFSTAYEPGVLEAIGYRNGIAVSRSELRSASGPLQLALTLEHDASSADGHDLAFVVVSITDAHGTVEMLTDDEVEVTVAGPAELCGFGSAAPSTRESYVTGTHTTFRGRALAVLRTTGDEGEVTVTATSQRTGTAHVTFSTVRSDSLGSGLEPAHTTTHTP